MVVLFIPLTIMVLRCWCWYIQCTLLWLQRVGNGTFVHGHSLVCKNVYYLLATKWLCIAALLLGSVIVLWWDIVSGQLYLVRHLCNLTSFCPMSRHYHKLCKGVTQYSRSWTVGCQHTYILPLIYIYIYYLMLLSVLSH